LTYWSDPSRFRVSTQSAGRVARANSSGSSLLHGGTTALPWNFLASAGFVNDIVGYVPQGYSEYNGLALQLNRRYANGFQ
jgi:hypothetical protein